MFPCRVILPSSGAPGYMTPELPSNADLVHRLVIRTTNTMLRFDHILILLPYLYIYNHNMGPSVFIEAPRVELGGGHCRPAGSCPLPEDSKYHHSPHVVLSHRLTVPLGHCVTANASSPQKTSSDQQPSPGSWEKLT